MLADSHELLEVGVDLILQPRRDLLVILLSPLPPGHPVEHDPAHVVHGRG